MTRQKSESLVVGFDLDMTATDAENPAAGSAPIASSTTQVAAPITTTIPPTTTTRVKAATVEPPVAQVDSHSI
jgi:hypothetical protein